MSEQHPNSQLEAVHARFERLLGLPPEVYQAESETFLDQRLAELDSGPHLSEISGITGNVQGFIHADTAIEPMWGQKPYRLDDPSMYASLPAAIRGYYAAYQEKIDDPIKAYRNAVLATAQHVQQTYFGNVHNSADAMARRDYLIGDYMDEGDGGPRSIAEFKGVAMCMERAAVANNVLQILGMSPVVELGGLQREGRDPEMHAFLFIQGGNGEDILFDPTNPSLVFGQDGSLRQASAALYKIGDLSEQRQAGESIVVTHKDWEPTEDGVIMRPQPYTYTLSAHGSDIRPS